MYFFSGLLAYKVENPLISWAFANGWDYFEFGVDSFINIAFLIASVVFVFIFIIGSFQWITSGADKNKLAEAKGKITHAIIGLLILLLIFLITQLVNLLLGLNIGLLGKPTSTSTSETEMITSMAFPPVTLIPSPSSTPVPAATPTPTSTLYPTSTPTATPTPSQQVLCQEASGVWKEFCNSCADKCSTGSCMDAITFGCDCGSGLCWNGSDCVYDSDTIEPSICTGGSGLD